MTHASTIVRSLIAGGALGVCAFALAGCDSKTAPANPPKPAGGAAQSDGHDHKHAEGDDHDHDHDHAKEGDKAHGDEKGHAHEHEEGPMADLGSASGGGWTVQASRSATVAAGKETVVDLSISGGKDKIRAVRVWFGTQDGAGSMKSKAELEDPRDAEAWHTHAEVPNPLPAGAKLWVELELENGTKSAVSFELKT
jgi:hypothetical protein